MGFAALALGAAFSATGGNSEAGLNYVFTETTRYEPKAWLEGRDRFPSGATLKLVLGETRRALAPGFSASADAAVSDDGSRVLFAGKQTPSDHWQVWEIDIRGGPARPITHCDADCIRPLYLPTNEIVYTRDSSSIEIAGKPLTFAPGRYLTDDVLRDGRILFEADRGTQRRELFTVYPDGSGVEALRCDHGSDRGEARQIGSGDSIFHSGNRLARFTSASAVETEVAQPEGTVIGPIAEVSPGVWLVSLRGRAGHLGLFRWNAAQRQTVPLEASGVQPVIVATRTPPRQFPSALVASRTAGNLLCLNSRISRTPMDGAAVRTVRVYAPEGRLGETTVESDGSFYIQVPADRPLRIELADAAGQTVRAEQGWFWMRPSEQRVCVGCHTGPERAPENRVPAILLKTIVPVKMLEVQQP
ncbi:MAG: hypothetical protein LAP40_11950 [Acidobacteriia bacterium]|nr:hypothetical protein [Terriglobia bacterium]